MSVSALLAKMLTTNTGSAMCDSGDAYGRHWERNKGKTVDDFMLEPDVSCSIGSYGYEYTISTFHYLLNSLQLDELCNKYNKLPCADWDSDICGVSESQSKWLIKHGLRVGASFNTYNGESNLSQVIQGTWLVDDGDNHYLLLQIHQGCDVRGGYTDAKLFQVDNGWLPSEAVYGTWYHEGKDIRVSNCYDGVKLTIDEGDNEGEEITPIEGDKIILELIEQ